MKYSRIISAVMATPWAIRPEKLSSILSFLRFKADDGEMSKEEIALVKQPAKEPAYFAISEGDTLDGRMSTATALEIAAGSPSNAQRSKAGQIAVLPISGTISHRMGMMSEMSGGTSTERFTQWLRAAVNDPSVKAIVLDVNSPGGTVDGVPELADEIYKANQIKPVTAVANAQAASAAYWLASQAKELVVTPSGIVGSIGVFGAHEDMSEALASAGVKISLVSAGKYKTEGNPFEPLSEEARAALQADVNNYYEMFTKAVARGRNSDQATVKAGFGEGRMVSAAKAVKAGMADRVATLDQTLARLGASASMPKQKMAAEGAAFGNVRSEQFELSAEAISPVDGYVYSEHELYVVDRAANLKGYRRGQTVATAALPADVAQEPGPPATPAALISALDLLERELELESL
jgi:signal peptide peptidase SppA